MGAFSPEDAQLAPSSALCREWLQDRVMNAAESMENESAPTGAERRKEPAALNPITVLRELFELLEDYAPTWYSEERHRRAEAVINAGPQ
jgi:hypothetical protein